MQAAESDSQAQKSLTATVEHSSQLPSGYIPGWSDEEDTDNAGEAAVSLFNQFLSMGGIAMHRDGMQATTKRWRQRVGEQNAAKMLRALGHTGGSLLEEESRADRVLRFITAAPGIAKSRLFQQTRTPTFERSDFQDAIWVLISEGKIREERTKGKRGAPRASYWPC